MATKALQKQKDNYITYDLEWLEKKIEELKEYVDSNPFQTLKDRIEWRETKTGGMIPMVVATIESQVKLLKEVLKELPGMFAALEELRKKEEAKKVEARGNKNIPAMMRKKLGNS